MTIEELIEKLELIQKLKCETPTLEIKSAEKGCPKHLYDSLSSFSTWDKDVLLKQCIGIFFDVSPRLAGVSVKGERMPVLTPPSPSFFI